MTDQTIHSQATRREFMIRCAKAGISVAAACGMGYGFYDALGPKPLDTLNEIAPVDNTLNL